MTITRDRAILYIREATAGCTTLYDAYKAVERFCEVFPSETLRNIDEALCTVGWSDDNAIHKWLALAGTTARAVYIDDGETLL